MNKPASPRRRRSSTPRARLVPIQSVSIVTPEGLQFLSQRDVTPAIVGQKAYGLSALPPGWTQPFFVVSDKCDLLVDELSSGGRRLRSFLREAIEQLSVPPGSLLIVRSSGIAETLSRRGSLKSDTCRSDQLWMMLRQLRKDIDGASADPVHWIVQIKVEPIEQGHLSNERRLKEEPRDWMVEIEGRGSNPAAPYIEPLAVRQWRDGQFALTDRLPCRYTSDLPNTLKQVAQWGMQFSSRLHFEWVWDGAFLNIVQVDAEESPQGMDPTAVIPAALESPGPLTLRRFRPALANDFLLFAKLKNAALYSELGYSMPPFYVLDDQHAIREILDGNVQAELISDLETLTVQPLIIRVDGCDVPQDKREMLPRSDELRSAAAAVDWLKEKFTPQIRNSNLEESSLCLISHHFIPAVASAWARAEPSGRWVRIESLWGVPEGLYWYSHDTFEVDTIAADPAGVTQFQDNKFVIRERKRFKGAFVAPSPEGHWIAHTTKLPFDWRRSIAKDPWLREIAATTRRIAIKEGMPISAMWFVDVRASARKHPVLPWFHSRSEYQGEVRAAPRRKISSHRDYTVRDRFDWQRLKDLVKERRINRVTVEPKDADLIRNQEFANSIVELAREHDFVVDLAGGLLSHIYYVLTRGGVRVECIDLYGADEDVLVFNKIVRDRIPGQIREGGERVDVVKLDGEALEIALKRKLVEEALEVLDSGPVDEVRSELADVLEVVSAIAKRHGITSDDLDSEKDLKQRKRGSFEEGLMLVRTATPHSLHPSEGLQLKEEELIDAVGESILANAMQAPSASNSRLAVKPDLRTVDGTLEKLISFAAEMPSLGTARGLTVFSFPNSRGANGPEVTLEIELRRVRGELRGAIRLRSAPAQFAFNFEDTQRS